MKNNKPLRALAAAAVAATVSLPAAALDLSWSGFGTLGWAQSNRGWAVERSIDRGGSAERDTLVGLQLDARLAERWSATLQLKAAESLERDHRWDVTPAWAFLAWRPDDDWLLRAGRMRLPLYLYSEILDVGATQDMVRLPTEMYSIAPSNEFDGLSATRTWTLGDDELSLDAYGGRARTTARFWARDGLAPAKPAGANFVEVEVHAVGAALTLRQPDTLWRAGMHHVRTAQTDGSRIPVTLPWVELAPGVGFYKTDDSIPYGPPVEAVSTITNLIFTLGVEHRFAAHWRVAAEYARDIQHDTELGSNTSGGYVALFREFGALTPYLAWSQLRSTRGTRDWYRRLTAHPLPESLPGAGPINAAQRLTAETIWAADQRSVALGASWTPAPGHKLKAEWKRTAIGQMSRLVDTPADAGTIHDTHVDVWSINYGFAF
ncbi:MULTISPECIES: hypothetical protein [unclassified Rubrivivax]|uniref:hypothetical protein n=1 Tax=unclassified Rubrivivax TaxID=2649762 RepID=UPI0013E94CF0|nr:MULTISPECIES: hypothetical protein [unclassified Rubrivivax]MCC9596853.1 hypothetical protein [Rubrivivax sp. JA1055]MCC9649009.1 hypothetical protein [Rubrivivax sp. JA1029]MCD0421168.1 hypothetical protein [Rubrivivax sp. JA1024]